MTLSYNLYEAIEDLSTCMYALAEESHPEVSNDVSCISSAIYAVDSIAAYLNLRYTLTDVVSYLDKVRGVHELNEDEVSIVIRTLKDMIEGELDGLKTALSVLYITNEIPNPKPIDLLLAVRAAFLNTLRVIEESSVNTIGISSIQAEVQIS
ncbi:MAG TPA: hypothetical protein EYH02_02995 [Ignisphaera aggregans]|uniref:Uncharacterized protein n=1 Tax=Ignisphaera aggregans TaxID=334771 RepID=A0A832YZB6_9CREN|nr:hypothetical protein [Ignisphaera aggregans]